MSTDTVKLLCRIGRAFLLLPALALLISSLGWAPGAFAISNPIRLIFSLAFVVLLFPRWWEAFKAPNPYGPREYASLGLLDVALAFAFASVWSSRASAAIHLDIASLDIGLRLTFAFFGVRGIGYLILAIGNIRDSKVPVSGYLRLGKIIIAAIVALGLVTFTGKIWTARLEQSSLHDTSPVGPDTDGHE